MFALRPSGLHAVPASRLAPRGAPVEALQQPLGAAQMGTVEHGPSLPDHPCPRRTREGRDHGPRFGQGRLRGREGRVDDRNLSRVDRQFPDETIPARLAAFPFERREVPIGEMNRVDRVSLGCGRREQGEVARQAIRTGPGSGPVAVGLGSQIGGEVLRPPGEPAETRMPLGQGRQRENGAGRLGGDGQDPRRAGSDAAGSLEPVGCASSTRMSALMTALGSTMP